MDRLKFLIAALTCLISCVFANGAASARSVSETERDSALAVRQLQLIDDSARLFQRGLERGDPVAMALAAEMRAEGIGAWLIDGDFARGEVFSPNGMFEAARRVAKGDELAVRMIDRIAGRRLRGRVDGPLVIRNIELGPSRYSVTETFELDMPAIVYVEAAAGGRVFLSVEHKDGDGICQRTTARDLCRWLPKDSGTVSIDIEAVNGEQTHVWLITN